MSLIFILFVIYTIYIRPNKFNLCDFNIKVLVFLVVTSNILINMNYIIMKINVTNGQAVEAYKTNLRKKLFLKVNLEWWPSARPLTLAKEFTKLSHFELFGWSFYVVIQHFIFHFQWNKEFIILTGLFFLQPLYMSLFWMPTFYF